MDITLAEHYEATVSDRINDNTKTSNIMAEKIINHNLRVITLVYDDAKQETDYEKELLQAYLTLHDHAVDFNITTARLNYEYKVHEDAVIDAEKEFVPVETQINQFYNTAQHLDSDSSFGELYEQINNYYPVINDIHNSVLQPLFDEANRLFNEYTEHENAEDKLAEELQQVEKLASNLYEKYNDYALDLVAWDEDIDDFKTVFSKATALYKESNKIESRYAIFVERIRTTWAIWDKTIVALNKYHDTDNLLDSSLSDSYASGTGDPVLKPVYLIEPGDELINKFRTQWGMMASSERNKLVLNVPAFMVQKGEVAMLQQLVMQLQHFPKMIEKWLFSIELRFADAASIPLQEADWKGVPEPMRWINTMMSLPCIIFFLEDRDVRAYALMGDLLADKKLEVQGARKVAIEGENLVLLCNRLYDACWFFHLYCHNTGFDPRMPIEALLAEFDLPVTYEQVYEQYLQYVKDGVHLKALPYKRK